MSVTTLYRFYNNDDELLYVGISEKGPERWKAHRKDKPWWTDVARTTTHHYDTRTEALDAERAAIIAEKPKHNVVHNRQRAATTTVTSDGIVVVGSTACADAMDEMFGKPNLENAAPTRWDSAGSRFLLEVGDVVAVHTLSDATPPVGRVTKVADQGFRLALYSWMTTYFGHKELLITWPDVQRMVFADSWTEGNCTVYGMDPLADFQNEYRRDYIPAGVT